jgi:hypothetical protein
VYRSVEDIDKHNDMSPNDTCSSMSHVARRSIWTVLFAVFSISGSTTLLVLLLQRS